MPVDQRCHQGQQGVQAGGQVHIHVDDDVGGAGLPAFPEREAPALTVEVADLDTVEFLRQRPGNAEGAIGTGVVDDDDLPGERELFGQKPVQHPDTSGQCPLLVVHRDHDVHGRGPQRSGIRRTPSPRTVGPWASRPRRAAGEPAYGSNYRTCDLIQQELCVLLKPLAYGERFAFKRAFEEVVAGPDDFSHHVAR
jgi:hypothetical protein